MRAFILGLLFLGLTSLCFAQVDNNEKLLEVEVYARNYNYLKSVKSDDTPPVILSLERKVAKFDVKSLNLVLGEKDTYGVSFIIPEGVIHAQYDNESNLIKTFEKFNVVNLPMSVLKTVDEEYPHYSISSDLYLVNYHYKKGMKKTYKITLANKNNVVKIKSDEKGNIL